MAESVDALVSNTSRATCAGSTPALGTTSNNVKALQSIDCSAFFAIHKAGRFAVKASLNFSLRLKVVPLHKDAKDITSGWRTPPVYNLPWW